MLKIFKRKNKEPEKVQVQKTPYEKKLHRESIKKRKAMRKNRSARIQYMESQGKHLIKGKKKKFNRPQDGNDSRYDYLRMRKEDIR